jgi:ATP-dependent RNA helicase DeaD
MNKQLSFADLGLNETIVNQIKKMGYENPTPVQTATIPKILEGLNIVGQSETGSGKTAAFALPILQKCMENPVPIKVLILSPTRELSMQIHTACNSFAPSVKTVCVYGGVGYREQINSIRSGAQLVVGTPGRILDLIRGGNLDISKIEHFVLDEADNMLSLGFIEDIQWVVDHIPAAAQKIMFSATIDRDIKHLIERMIKGQHELISVKSETRTAKNIEQYFMLSAPYEEGKLKALESVFEMYNPLSTVVFVPTKISTTVVGDHLRSLGLKVAMLHGDIDQKQRERTVEQFRQMRLQVLIATDVIARGLDIDHVSHVINWGLPKDSDCYIHRVGRTGRVGRSGVAITIITNRERNMLKNFERATRQLMTELKLPTSEEIYSNRVKHYVEKIQSVASSTDLAEFTDIQNKLKAIVPEDNLIRALIKIVQMDKPLKSKQIAPRPFIARDSKERFSDRPDRFSSDRGVRRNDTNRDSFKRDSFAKRDSGVQGPRDRSERFSSDRPDRFSSDRGVRRNDTNRDSGVQRDNGKYAYRIDLGHNDGVMPADIFTSLISKIGMSKSDIGRIRIQDDHTLVYTYQLIDTTRNGGLLIMGKQYSIQSQNND